MLKVLQFYSQSVEHIIRQCPNSVQNIPRNLTSVNIREDKIYKEDSLAAPGPS